MLEEIKWKLLSNKIDDQFSDSVTWKQKLDLKIDLSSYKIPKIPLAECIDHPKLISSSMPCYVVRVIVDAQHSTERNVDCCSFLAMTFNS